jgi:hypothetical protein
MHYSDYLREQAAEYRRLAEAADDPAKQTSSVGSDLRGGQRSTIVVPAGDHRPRLPKIDQGIVGCHQP